MQTQMQVFLVLAVLVWRGAATSYYGASTEKIPSNYAQYVEWPETLDGTIALIPENPPTSDYECTPPWSTVAAQPSRQCGYGALFTKTVGSNGYTDCGIFETGVDVSSVTYNFGELINLSKVWHVQYGFNSNHLSGSLKVFTSSNGVTFVENAWVALQTTRWGRTIVTLDSPVVASHVRIDFLRNSQQIAVCTLQLYGLPQVPEGVGELDLTSDSGNLGNLTIKTLAVDWRPTLPAVQGNLTQALIDAIAFSISPAIPTDMPDLTFDSSTGRISGDAPPAVFDGRAFNVTGTVWWSSQDSTARVIFASDYTVVSSAADAQCTQFCQRDNPASKAANAAWCQARSFEK
jgi:hypothetical protein